MKSTIGVVVVAACLVGFGAHAQWRQLADRDIPRTASGAPNLMAPVPKALDGRPDLSGVWLPDGDALPSGAQTVEGDLPLPRHLFNIAADLSPEDVALQPWAAELLQQRLQDSGRDDPTAHCRPSQMPMINSLPTPYKIVQTPRLVLVLYEQDTIFRQIFLDDRRPVQNALPRWMGYSTGKWEGDVLVVDTVGFHDRLLLDAMGHPNTAGLHLVERFRRRDAGHLDIEMTIDDPGAYKKPITYTVNATAFADDDLLEYFCTENEKDVRNFQ